MDSKSGIAHSIPIPNPLLMNPNPIPTQIYTIPTPNPIPLHMIPNPESNPDSTFDCDSGFGIAPGLTSTTNVPYYGHFHHQCTLHTKVSCPYKIIVYSDISIVLECTQQAADNSVHSSTVLWEYGYFLTSNLLCPFNSVKSCLLILLPVLIWKNILRSILFS